MKYRRTLFLLIGVICSGCMGTSTDVNVKKTNAKQSDVDSLNRQIAAFNGRRGSTNEGISPIEQRVARVEYDQKQNRATAFSTDGKVFLVLKRGPDGRFKGILQVPYHEAAGSGADGSHSWGTVEAIFFLGRKWRTSMARSGWYQSYGSWLRRSACLYDPVFQRSFL